MSQDIDFTECKVSLTLATKQSWILIFYLSKDKYTLNTYNVMIINTIYSEKATETESTTVIL